MTMEQHLRTAHVQARLLGIKWCKELLFTKVLGVVEEIPKLTDQYFEEIPLHKALGVKLEKRSADYARISLKSSDTTQGGVAGGIHGGVMAALVDIATIAALFNTQTKDLEGYQPAGTADLNITYLRPALSPIIFAEAKVVKRGKMLAMIEVDIKDDNGTLCGIGRTLYAFRKETT